MQLRPTTLWRRSWGQDYSGSPAKPGPWTPQLPMDTLQRGGGPTHLVTVREPDPDENSGYGGEDSQTGWVIRKILALSRLRSFTVSYAAVTWFHFYYGRRHRLSSLNFSRTWIRMHNVSPKLKANFLNIHVFWSQSLHSCDRAVELGCQSRHFNLFTCCHIVNQTKWTHTLTLEITSTLKNRNRLWQKCVWGHWNF